VHVTAVVADRTGCGTYRLIGPAEVLNATEADVEVDVVDGLPLLHDIRGRIVGIDPGFESDIVVFQRPLHQWMADLTPKLQRRGIKVVGEIDDDFRALDSANPAFQLHHPKLSPLQNWDILGQVCGLADLVTCATPALAKRYGAHGRALVLPNLVRERLLDIPRAGDGRTVGWAGLAANHPQDLQVTHGGVAQAIEASGARFLNVGTGDAIQKNLGLRDEPEVTGWLAMDDYFEAIARFDVGIAPLADTKFNEAKSWLKPLEMAALGVPCVASPRREYTRLPDMGVGVLAGDRSREWRREVRLLLQNPGLREEQSEHGREVVREHWTLERGAWRWAEAWASVLEASVVR
jgi:glycosyltransferase involved in cell wall biosynthesis